MRQTQLVSRPRLRVLQRAVGLVNLLEAALGHGVAQVEIGVENLGEALERLPDLLIVRPRIDGQGHRRNCAYIASRATSGNCRKLPPVAMY